MMLIELQDYCQTCFGTDESCCDCIGSGQQEVAERLLALQMQMEAYEIATSQAIAALDEAIELAQGIGPRALPVIRKCEEALRALGIETAVILAPTMVDRVQRWVTERRGGAR